MQFETSETGFTPGPWCGYGYAVIRDINIKRTGYPLGIQGKPQFIVRHVERQADRDLIAAAPAMFEALTYTARILAGFGPHKRKSDATMELLAAGQMIEEALALAQGKPGRDPNCDTALDRDARNMDALHNRPEEMP